MILANAPRHQKKMKIDNPKRRMHQRNNANVYDHSLPLETTVLVADEGFEEKGRSTYSFSTSHEACEMAQRLD